MRELAPLVFAAAGDGDPVARRIVDDLADEVVAWSVAMIRRLHLTRTDVPVVLAGGTFRTTDEPFYSRIRSGIAAVAPAARVRVLSAPPVLGSALIGLDRLALGPSERSAAEASLRSALTFERLGLTGSLAEQLVVDEPGRPEPDRQRQQRRHPSTWSSSARVAGRRRLTYSGSASGSRGEALADRASRRASASRSPASSGREPPAARGGSPAPRPAPRG